MLFRSLTIEQYEEINKYSINDDEINDLSNITIGTDKYIDELSDRSIEGVQFNLNGVTGSNSTINPFLENNINESEGNAIKGVMLDHPPEYIANRKSYIGSPNFALVKTPRNIKRVSNKILGIGKGSL